RDAARGGEWGAVLSSRQGGRRVGFVGKNREHLSTRQRYEAFIARTSDMAVGQPPRAGRGGRSGWPGAHGEGCGRHRAAAGG
ncbi:hypothetical protein M8371_33065, partial [Klebsiella pneumoniae]|nr:hypothetical protein [Klebsiella pneumoniae]